MPVRELEKKDLEKASALCIKAFMESVAPGLSSKGVETFQDIASVEGFSKRLSEGHLMLVFEEDANLTGLIELRNGCHLVMLFVDPDNQGRGVGKALVTAMTTYTQAKTITVNASLNSVSAYTRYGFTHAGDSDARLGLKYQPMELNR